MISYTVDVAVPIELTHEWLSYMQDIHVRDVLATGYFIDALIEQVVEPSVADMTVFRVRYLLETQDNLSAYRATSAPALQAHHTERFGSAVHASRSVAIVQSLWPREA